MFGVEKQWGFSKGDFSWKPLKKEIFEKFL